MQEDNVSVMLRIADERQAMGLRKKCMDFILKNFGRVIGTKVVCEWNAWL
jgi:hypothetical protein